MSDLPDAAATLVLAAVFFAIGASAGGDAGLIIGVAGALSAGYVAARVGTLRERVADLEATLENTD